MISNIIVSNMPQTQYTINPGLDLDMLGTIPEYRRLGVANMLVKWELISQIEASWSDLLMRVMRGGLYTTSLASCLKNCLRLKGRALLAQATLGQQRSRQERSDTEQNTKTTSLLLLAPPVNPHEPLPQILHSRQNTCTSRNLPINEDLSSFYKPKPGDQFLEKLSQK